MNIIAARMAVSLYAHATFVRRAAIPLEFGSTTPLHSVAEERDKYVARGWSMDTSLDISQTISILGGGYVRTIGDRHCWTIPLHLDQPSRTPSTDYDPILVNSWRIVGAGRWTMVECAVVDLEVNRYSYVTTRPADVKALVASHLDRVPSRISAFDLARYVSFTRLIRNLQVQQQQSDSG